MNNKEVQKTFHSLMQFAGVTVNGTKPYDIHVYNGQLYSRVVKQAALGP